MSSEKYLAIDIRKDPASIVASDFPVAWDMRYDHRDIAFRSVGRPPAIIQMLNCIHT